MDVLPVFFQNGEEVFVSLSVVLVLEVHRSHDDVKFCVKSNFRHVILHKKVCFFLLAFLEAELSIIKPSRGI